MPGFPGAGIWMDDAQQKTCQFWLLTLWLSTFWLLAMYFREFITLVAVVCIFRWMSWLSGHSSSLSVLFEVSDHLAGLVVRAAAGARREPGTEWRVVT